MPQEFTYVYLYPLLPGPGAIVLALNRDVCTIMMISGLLPRLWDRYLLKAKVAENFLGRQERGHTE
eukprot:1970553-Amphidinium_carterae.2